MHFESDAVSGSTFPADMSRMRFEAYEEGSCSLIRCFRDRGVVSLAEDIRIVTSGIAAVNRIARSTGEFWEEGAAMVKAEGAVERDGLVAIMTKAGAFQQRAYRYRYNMLCAVFQQDNAGPVIVNG